MTTAAGSSVLKMNGRNDIRKIVVRGTNWLGDAVMSVPALRELSRIFPDAEIVLHSKGSVNGIFADADFIDRIMPFENRPSKIRRTIEEADRLIEDDFDLAILFPNSFESALTSRLAKIPRRIGYNKDLRGLLLTHPIPVPEWKEHQHEVFYYLNLVAEAERKYLGTSTVPIGPPDISIPVSAERQARAATRLVEMGADPSKKVIAIGAGSTNSMAKRWPAERFASLASALAAEVEAEIILMGSDTERQAVQDVADLCGVPTINIAGETSVEEAAAVLSVADLLVSNDMGLAHLAPAVGTKTAVIFGPTNPVTTRPYSDNAVVIRTGVDCSPCMLRDCPIDHRCMTGIAVDSVLGVCLELLEAKDDAWVI
ncbi:MAG: lipopolysaccharide heptosyltransferase II [Chloracidobacterium sp.]|nr:lipopolysaccharide heptosyltransferase II [Chloracidobacterium sp.]